MISIVHRLAQSSNLILYRESASAAVDLRQHQATGASRGPPLARVLPAELCVWETCEISVALRKRTSAKSQ